MGAVEFRAWSKTYTSATDANLIQEGIGLTDIVKRPTNSSGELKHTEFDEGRQLTYQKLEQAAPLVVCFVGILGATAFLGHQVKPGPLKERLGPRSCTLYRRRVDAMRITDEKRF